MRFVRAKGDTVQCHQCGSFLMRNEEMVLVFIKNRAFSRLLTFHTKCYSDWWLANYHIRWAEWHHGTGNFRRPKLGRPCIHLNPTGKQIIHRLQASKSYYKKIGDKDMVEILQNRIKKYQKEHPI